MKKYCIRCKEYKEETDYEKNEYNSNTKKICKPCDELIDWSVDNPMDWYASVNYQQQWAKKYFKEKWTNQWRI